jgi:hypothetical protein
MHACSFFLCIIILLEWIWGAIIVILGKLELVKGNHIFGLELFIFVTYYFSLMMHATFPSLLDA